jgi:hypothetical protein
MRLSTARKPMTHTTAHIAGVSQLLVYFTASGRWASPDAVDIVAHAREAARVVAIQRQAASPPAALAALAG